MGRWGGRIGSISSLRTVFGEEVAGSVVGAEGLGRRRLKGGMEYYTHSDMLLGILGSEYKKGRSY